jgi:hypothetical protein
MNDFERGVYFDRNKMNMKKKSLKLNRLGRRDSKNIRSIPIPSEDLYFTPLEFICQEVFFKVAK